MIGVHICKNIHVDSFCAQILVFAVWFGSQMILRWNFDGNHSKYWYNMMKINCHSIGLYSLKNCRNSFGKRFRPFRMIYHKHTKSYLVNWHPVVGMWWVTTVDPLPSTPPFCEKHCKNCECCPVSSHSLSGNKDCHEIRFSIVQNCNQRRSPPFFLLHKVQLFEGDFLSFHFWTKQKTNHLVKYFQHHWLKNLLKRCILLATLSISSGLTTIVCGKVKVLCKEKLGEGAGGVLNQFISSW